MVENKTEISGRAMAVIIGVICLITPWFSQLGFWTKLIITVIGAVLIFLGVK